MLGILVLILKIVLFIILGILGLLLTLLLIVLWTPIRYKVFASKGEVIKAKGSVTYFFKSIRVCFEYDDDVIKYRVKILFFTVVSEGYDEAEVKLKEMSAPNARPVSKVMPVEEPKVVPEDKPSKETEDASKNEPKIESEKALTEVPDDEPSIEPKVESPEALTEVPEDKPKKEPKNEPKIEVKEKSKSVEQKPQSSSKSRGKKKTKNTDGSSPFDEVKRYYRFFKASENKGMIKFVLKMIGKMFKSILPRRMSGYVNFGTDDPAMTGYIVGAVSVFYPVYQDNFVMTPDFEGSRLEGHVEGKGRIIIGVLVFYALRILIDRRVRRLIKEVRK